MVHHVHVSLTVYGDAPGGIELALLATQVPPLRQILAILGELLDTMVKTVNNVQVIILVYGDA